MTRRTFPSACLASVFLISVQGCATRTDVESPSLRRLKNAELAILFSDAGVVPASGSSVSTVYYADGRYKIEHGWEIWGTYTIENDEVCVVTQTQKVPFCKRYARDASGDVFRISSGFGDEAPREGPPYTKMTFSPFCIDPEKVPPLSEIELRDVFLGSVVSDISGGSYEEKFFADGRHRIEAEGGLWSRYSIAGNEVCVTRENQGPTYCRKFTKGEAGSIRLLLSEPGNDQCMSTPVQYAIRPIQEE